MDVLQKCATKMVSKRVEQMRGGCVLEIWKAHAERASERQFQFHAGAICEGTMLLGACLPLHPMQRNESVFEAGRH